jgi:hypothetical protein
MMHACTMGPSSCHIYEIDAAGIHANAMLRLDIVGVTK